MFSSSEGMGRKISNNDEKSKEWSEVECMFRLKEFCKHYKIAVSQSILFRFACFNSFDFDSSSRALKRNYSNRLLHLKMEGSLSQNQLQDQAIVFPLPDGLETKGNKSKVLYFRLSRFMPSEERNKLLVDNFCYVLNDASRTEEQCRNGVVLILNTKGFIDRRNLDKDSIALFAQAVQGQLVPTKVNLVLVLGATTRFQNSWKQIMALLSPFYANRFRFISQYNLGDFFMDGYEQYLPDEIGGCRDCMEISEDYVDLKLHEERSGKD